jgi:hypothetical protein
MRRFQPEVFVDLPRLLAPASRSKGPLPEKTLRGTHHVIDYLIQECGANRWNASLATARALKKRLTDDPQTPDDVVKRGMMEICHRLVDEMGGTLFLALDFAKSDFYKNADKHPFGEGVSVAFPSAVFDIEEAGRCIGLERNTAAVLHCMRISEIGLNALAAALEVPFDERNWGNIIPEIVAELGKRDKAATRGSPWRNESSFYAEAATQFEFVRIAWRNHAMHVRDKYDEERARRIYDHTRDLMQHLATKLHE